MPSWQSSISDYDTWELARFIPNFPRRDAGSASTAVRSQAQAAISAQDMYTLKSLILSNAEDAFRHTLYLWCPHPAAWADVGV
jgi:hypothetical protein